MATSINTHYKNQLKATEDQMNADISAVEDALNKNLAIIDENYATDVANTERQYNALYGQNNVDRIVNERKIAENMANLGMTDSGLNRTQLTANQLSYANTNNKISVAKQQAIDTLALTMRNKKTELETTANTDIAGIKSSYSNAAMNNATSQYNAEVQAEADMYEASLKAMSDAQQNANQMKKDMYNDYYKSGGIYDDLHATVDVKDAYGNVTGTKPKYSDDKKANQFVRWVDQYVTDYSDKNSAEIIAEYLTKLAPSVQEKIIPQLNEKGMYVDVSTPAVDNFLTKVPTAFEFNTKYMQDDNIRKRYAGRGGGYKQYISDLIDKDSLTDNDIATIIYRLELN